MLFSIVLPFIVLFALTYISTRRKAPKGFRLPPGPKGLPILGNVLDIPPSRPEKKFLEWSKEYGELFRIQIGWNDWVFVNTDVAAKVSYSLA
jgi:Cytochrome P450